MHFSISNYTKSKNCKGRASAAAPAMTRSQSAAWSRASRWPPRRQWSGRCTRGTRGCCSPAAPWRSCRAGQPRCRHARVRAARALNSQCHLCKARPAGMGGRELACTVLGGSAGRGPHAIYDNSAAAPVMLLHDRGHPGGRWASAASAHAPTFPRAPSARWAQRHTGPMPAPRWPMMAPGPAGAGRAWEHGRMRRRRARPPASWMASVMQKHHGSSCRVIVLVCGPRPADPPVLGTTRLGLKQRMKPSSPDACEHHRCGGYAEHHPRGK